MTVDGKKRTPVVKPKGLRLVVKHSDYAKNRAKYHKLATSRRRVVVEDEDGSVAFAFGG